MDDIDYPFMVSTWLEAQPELGFLGKAKWVEVARCPTEFRARKIARSLSSLMEELVQISVLQEEAFVPIDWYPDKETVEQKLRGGAHE